MSPSVISLIGILLGMVILVFLAFKGYNVIIVSVIAALVVAVFAGTDILPLIIDSYMTKFADFAKNNFMIFPERPTPSPTPCCAWSTTFTASEPSSWSAV